MMAEIKNTLLLFREIRLKGLQGKILFFSLFPIFLLSIGGGFVYFQVSKMSNVENHLLETTVPALAASKELNTEANALSKHIWEIIAEKGNSTKFEENADNIERSIDQLRDIRERYLSIEMDSKTNAIRKRAEIILKELDPVLDQLKENAFKKNDDKIYYIATNEVLPKFLALQDILSNIEINNIDLIEDEKNNSNKISSQAKKSIIFSSALAGLLSLISSILFGARISNSLTLICNELASEANKTKENAVQVAKTSQAIAKAATQTAAAIQGTSTATEEMTAMISRTSENAEHSSELSISSVQRINEGKNSILQTKTTVEEIRNANDEMTNVVLKNNEKLVEMHRVVSEIGNKTKIIDDIVFQTKLLAFNASVEAARAGDHGKGFSVVAEEVGNLAKKSGQASQEISKLLSESMERVQSIVQENKKSITDVAQKIQQRVHQSEQTVRNSLDLLDQIVKGSTDVNSMLMDIKTATKDQGLGVAEVLKSMHELDSTAQNNMKSGQNIAIASEQLLKQSEQLNVLVKRLEMLVEG